jgi:hypothetical protein
VTHRLCSFTNCDKSYWSKGYCKGHYAQLRRGATLSPLRVHNKAKNGHKMCGLCGVVKPVELFGRKLHYHTEYCRECRNVKLRADTYGLSLDEVRELMRRSTCESCGNAFVGTKDMHIDHCHDSGRVRGLLCGGCNTALGLLQESPERIAALLVYLNQHQLI